jgi:hypothetical protein
LAGQAARDRAREEVPDADPQDLLLLDDLLGIADPEVELPQIDPDARRRRLTALLNTASLARTDPALFIIEDAHWIDAVSESMVAELLTVVSRAKLIGDCGTDRRTAGVGSLGSGVGGDHRRAGGRESVFRRGDGARVGAARGAVR